MDTIAAFIAGEMACDGTGVRFWSNRYAMGTPSRSVTVVTAGRTTRASSGDYAVTDDPDACVSPPRPPINVKATPATMSPAITHTPSRRTAALARDGSEPTIRCPPESAPTG